MGDRQLSPSTTSQDPTPSDFDLALLQEFRRWLLTSSRRSPPAWLAPFGTRENLILLRLRPMVDPLGPGTVQSNKWCSRIRIRSPSICWAFVFSPDSADSRLYYQSHFRGGTSLMTH